MHTKQPKTIQPSKVNTKRQYKWWWGKDL